MQWDHPRNSKKAHILPPVLELCCKTFLSQSIDQKHVAGFKYCSWDNVDYKFCSNPSYWHDNGQSAHMWYNWVDFLYKYNNDNEFVCPAQILCFISLTDQQGSKLPEGGFPGGDCAVVQSLVHKPHPICQSLIVEHGNVNNKLYIGNLDFATVSFG